MEIARLKELQIIRNRLENTPIIALLGPRQCGKTTLSRQLARQIEGPVHVFDLEDPIDLQRLDHPTLALEPLSGLVIIDEIQRRPDLFPILRVLVDRPAHAARFLILGSASRDLIRQGSETLAGRISYVEMGGFSLAIPNMDVQRLWIRGAFPQAYLAIGDVASFQWRGDFVTTFLERDIPNLGIRIPTRALRQFWTMLAHSHGQIFNASAFGRSLGLDDVTMKRYLDILSGTFMMRQLQPWFYNTKKRLVKRPKVYFRDSGILHTLLTIRNAEELTRHPVLGASWEGLAMEQAIAHLGLHEEETFFWGVHAGASLDLCYQRGGGLWGVEMKYHEAPSLTSSMRAALDELSLQHLWVLYPGKTSYALHKKVTVLPLIELCSLQS
ncbi:MAG: ATP-binding protein [Deltaproteobacteria bacterium]|nr:ATP-binding protein [Deltaproteobacteria bacterium]